MSKEVAEDLMDPTERPHGPAPVKTEVEEDDPYDATAVMLPSPPGFDSLGSMARCMAEEYAMMGFSGPLLLKMFRNPFYQALHGVWQARGDAYVVELLRGVFGNEALSDEVVSSIPQPPRAPLETTIPVVSANTDRSNPHA